VVEWKNQDHCTEEASDERHNRVSCEDCNTGSPYEGTGVRNGTGIIGGGEVPPESVRLVPEYPAGLFAFGDRLTRASPRRFGIRLSCFYRWKGRYDPKRLSSLENKPPVPKRKREPCYSRKLVRAVRAVREAAPGCSAKKIRPILSRSMAAAEVPSAAALGRLIAREHLFFRTVHGRLSSLT
jgi:hypothetical protein